MSRHEKMVKRFLDRPADFTWNELTAMLKCLGYVQSKAGKTGGSRVRFEHPEAGMIILHRPHPTPVLKRYIIDQITEVLKRGNMI